MSSTSETPEALEAAPSFEADMELINRARNEIAAVSIDPMDNGQTANYARQAVRQNAGAGASMIARGMALGSIGEADRGSNLLTINSNTTRRAWRAAQPIKNCLKGRACRRRRLLKGE